MFVLFDKNLIVYFVYFCDGRRAWRATIGVKADNLTLRIDIGGDVGKNPVFIPTLRPVDHIGKYFVAREDGIPK